MLFNSTIDFTHKDALGNGTTLCAVDAALAVPTIFRTCFTSDQILQNENYEEVLQMEKHFPTSEKLHERVLVPPVGLHALTYFLFY